MPQLRIITSTSRGGAEVWDEEVTVEHRPDGIIAISRQGSLDLQALVLAVGGVLWICETPQSASAEYLIRSTDGRSILAQWRQAGQRQ